MEITNLSWAAASNTAPHLLSEPADRNMYPEYDAHTGIISADLDAYIFARLPPSSPVALLGYVDVYFKKLNTLE